MLTERTERTHIRSGPVRRDVCEAWASWPVPVDSRTSFIRNIPAFPLGSEPKPGVQVFSGSSYEGVMDWTAVPSPPLCGPPPAPRGLSGGQPLLGAQVRSEASWVTKTGLPAGRPGVLEALPGAPPPADEVRVRVACFTDVRPEPCAWRGRGGGGGVPLGLATPLIQGTGAVGESVSFPVL